MFNVSSDVNSEGNLVTVRTVSCNRLLTIRCLGVDEQAVEEAEKYLSDFSGIFGSTLKDIYKRVWRYKFGNKSQQEKDIVSKDLKYHSHYLAHRLCRFMEKAFYVIENKELISILKEVNTKYEYLCSCNNYLKSIGDMISNLDRSIREIEYLDVSKGLSTFSNIDEMILEHYGDYFDNNKIFCIIKECTRYMSRLSMDLGGISLNIVKICEIQKVREDEDLMSKLYPIYRNLEGFLKEWEKVDLSDYELKLAREKEEVKREEGVKKVLGVESLLNDGADMLDNISALQKRGAAQLTQEDMQKLRDILNNCQRQLDEVYKKGDFTKVDYPQSKNTIEGQELPFENQEGRQAA